MKLANVKGLEIFIFVMEEGTLARAAQRMNLSQPAASRLLALLEQELGVPLFMRRKQRLVPTEAAARFHREAVRALASVNNLPTLFSEILSGGTVPLCVICNPRLMSGLIIPALAIFSELRPEVRVRLFVRPRNELEQGLVRERFDVGAGSLPVRNTSIESEWLARSPLMVVLPANHRLADRATLSAEELSDERYVAMGLNTIVRSVVDARSHSNRDRLNPHYEASTAEAVFRLVRAGMGFTICDTFGIPADLLQDVARVPLQPEISIDFGLFHLPDSPRHEASEDFVQAVRQVALGLL